MNLMIHISDTKNTQQNFIPKVRFSSFIILTLPIMQKGKENNNKY